MNIHHSVKWAKAWAESVIFWGLREGPVMFEAVSLGGFWDMNVRSCKPLRLWCLCSYLWREKSGVINASSNTFTSTSLRHIIIWAFLRLRSHIIVQQHSFIFEADGKSLEWRTCNIIYVFSLGSNGRLEKAWKKRLSIPVAPGIASHAFMCWCLCCFFF